MAQTNYTPIILYNSGTTGNTPSTSNLASGELAINYTDGKLFYKDNSSTLQVIGWKTTPTTAGGTGLTSYTAGDLPYYASGTALSKLGIGTSGYVLESNGSAPTWVAQSTLSVGTATNATNVATTDNTSSSSTYYPTLVSATSGNNGITTSSTKLSFVPSTGLLTTVSLTATGSITPSQTAGIIGTTTNNNANTGSFGEFVSSQVLNSSAVSLTTNTFANVTSISLTAGDWDVSGILYFAGTSTTTVTQLIAGSSSSSASLGSQGAYWLQGFNGALTLSAQDLGQALPVYRYSLSSTTTIYLFAYATFGVSTVKAYGLIQARRVR